MRAGGEVLTASKARVGEGLLFPNLMGVPHQCLISFLIILDAFLTRHWSGVVVLASSSSSKTILMAFLSRNRSNCIIAATSSNVGVNSPQAPRKV